MQDLFFFITSLCKKFKQPFPCENPAYPEQGYHPKDTGQDRTRKNQKHDRFFACVFGLNFTKESLIALPSIFRPAKALFCFVRISVNLLYAMLPKNSASEPRASAGKKLSAPISNTTTISRKTNTPFVVDKEPAVVEFSFFQPCCLRLQVCR